MRFKARKRDVEEEEDMGRSNIARSPIFIATTLGLLAFIFFVLWNVDFEISLRKPVTLEEIKRKYKEIQANRSFGVEHHETLSPAVHKLTPKTEQFIWTDNSGDFRTRITAYNWEIDKLRTEILESRHLSEWKDLSNGTINVLWYNRDDFMMILQRFSQVKTVILPWLINAKSEAWSTLTDQHNVLVQIYYEWTATEPLCTWIKTPGLTKARWDAVYNRTCNTDASRAFQPKSLDHVYFHGKPINVRDYWPNDGFSYPSYFYNELPDRVFYINVIQDGLITGFGDVLSGNLKVVPYSCGQDIKPEPPVRYHETPIYSEVFVITQYWGDAFYHKMNEVLPRIAPYVEFLQKNKNIKLHVAEEHGYSKASLKFLDFAPERIITGSTRAKVVYLPQATPCGFAQPQEIQLLSEMYRERIHKYFEPLERNLVVFIHRSGLRHFHRQNEVEFVVEKTATHYGYEYVRFGDQPTPSMEMTMQMFAQAIMVVAPHGAGLSNVIYSEPGTFVIEGVCNRPHVNMCYQWTSHILGHRYHAIPSRRGCEGEVDIEPAMIEFVMSTYLEQIQKSNYTSQL